MNLTAGSTKTGHGTSGDVLASLACVWVATGAMYFGLWSCGNGTWKADVFRVGAWLLTLTALALPGRWLSTVPRKLAFPVGLYATYVLVESAVAPFYPVAPTTWREYGDTFFMAAQHGPCG